MICLSLNLIKIKVKRIIQNQFLFVTQKKQKIDFDDGKKVVYQKMVNIPRSEITVSKNVALYYSRIKNKLKLKEDPAQIFHTSMLLATDKDINILSKVVENKILKQTLPIYKNLTFEQQMDKLKIIIMSVDPVEIMCVISCYAESIDYDKSIENIYEVKKDVSDYSYLMLSDLMADLYKINLFMKE